MTTTRQLAVVLALSAASLAGCWSPTKQAGASYVPNSGTIALSADDARLYVADADHRALFVLDAESGSEVARVDLGAEPAEVIAAPNGAVFVSLRSGKGVARVLQSDFQVAVRGTTGAEPVGLGLSPDGKRLYVANMISRSLSVLDVDTLQRVRPDIAVGTAPRAVAALEDGRVYVGDFLAGRVSVVDPDAGRVTSEVDLVLPASAQCGGGDERSPTAVAALIVAPGGKRVYAAHVQSRLDVLPAGEQRWGAPGGSLAQAVAPAIATIETGADRLLLDATDAFGGCLDADCSAQPDFPPPLLVTSCGPPPGMDAPSAIVADPRGEWLFVADHNSNAVAVLSATRRTDRSFRFPERGLVDVVPVGARPQGLAISRDGTKLYVHAAFDYTVARMEAVGPSPRDLRVVRRFTYARSPLSPEVERGRRLFYSAVDPRMTQPELGGVSCSSCHPEGRTDGLSWRFGTRDGRGELREQIRNTPALWGVAETAPYHWDGLVASLPAFSSRMVETMGGAGLGDRDAADLDAYLASIPAPDAAAPAAAADEGRRLFEGSAGCASCHSGALLTDRKRHGISGAFDGTASVDTPSLRGLRATPPYLHDGSAATLEVVLGPGAGLAEHRASGKLAPEEIGALVAYLETL